MSWGCIKCCTRQLILCLIYGKLLASFPLSPLDRRDRLEQLERQRERERKLREQQQKEQREQKERERRAEERRKEREARREGQRLGRLDLSDDENGPFCPSGLLFLLLSVIASVFRLSYSALS